MEIDRDPYGNVVVLATLPTTKTELNLNLSKNGIQRSAGSTLVWGCSNSDSELMPLSFPVDMRMERRGIYDYHKFTSNPTSGPVDIQSIIAIQSTFRGQYAEGQCSDKQFREGGIARSYRNS